MRSLRSRLCRVVLLFLPFHIAVDGSAQEWPQWRGPNRDGVVASFTKRDSWPEQLQRKWKVEVGEGHSSPVVSGERVFLCSRQGDEEVASCRALIDGKLLWEQRYPAPYRVTPVAAYHGAGPKSTSIVTDGKLFTLGISGILSCFDAASGQLRWRKTFSHQYKQTAPLYGTAMSPLVADGLLVAHVGGHDDGALTAFEVETGEVRWQWKGDGPGYTSPIIVTMGGVQQVVTQTQNFIVGVSLQDGKLLWTIPFRTAYDQNAVTPIAFEDLLILSGHQKRTFAVRAKRGGSGWDTEEVWSNRDVSMYMSSPVLLGHLLFGFAEKRRGTLFCLDARTGKTLWVGPGRQGDNAALLLAGDDLLVQTTAGELIVVLADRERYEPAARYQVADSPTWAHPALAGDQLLIKDVSSLALWSLR